MENLIVLLIVFPMMFLSYFVHNRMNNQVSNFLIMALCLATAVLVMDTQTEIALFVLGTIFGYIIEFIGVFTKNWRYNTYDGYNLWSGTGWGLVILTTYVLRDMDFLLLVALMLTTLVIIRNNLAAHKTRDFSVLAEYPVRFSLMLFFPRMFLTAFTIGTIVEHFGMRFRIWKYQRVKYINIASGYAVLSVLAILIYEFLYDFRTLEPVVVFIGLLVLGFYLYHVQKYGEKHKDHDIQLS